MVALGFIAPLLILELAFRLLGPFIPGDYRLGTIMVPDQTYGHYHARSTSGWIRSAEFVTPFRFNRLGHRGADPPPDKAAGVGRILILGDSFAEAIQVHESMTAAAILERELSARPGSCQVMNSGVAGWGTGEQYVYLRTEGVALKPDLVLVMFYIGNDLGNNLRRDTGQAPQHRGPVFRASVQGELSERPFEPVPEIPAWLHVARTSRAFSYFETGVVAKLTEDEDDEFRAEAGKADVFVVRETQDRRQALRVTEVLLRRIRELAGGKAAVVAIPASYQVYPQEWRRVAPRRTGEDRWEPEIPNQRMAETTQRAGVPMLDLLDVMRRESVTDERLYFIENSHWTERGNAIAAREIVAFLRGRGLLPAGCS
jgi:hypothetical protein